MCIRDSLFLAALLGGFIAWAFSLCKCNSEELQRELDGARAERDELAARLGARQSQDGGRDEALIASLEAQLSEARLKIADLEKNGAGGAALGLAGGAASVSYTHLDVYKRQLSKMFQQGENHFYFAN